MAPLHQHDTFLDIALLLGLKQLPHVVQVLLHSLHQLDPLGIQQDKLVDLLGTLHHVLVLPVLEVCESLLTWVLVLAG